jgi:hypothetical protein
LTDEDVIEKERPRYQVMHDFVKSLGSEWFIFKYEDMIDKKFDALHEYLGFEIKDDAEIPRTTKKSKVSRRKAYGDRRHCYTEEDVAFCKPVYLPYMELIGYDCDDGMLSSEPVIESEYASICLKGLVRKNRMNNIRNFKESILKRFT